MNVKIICVCFCIRFLFDFSRLVHPRLYNSFRESSANDPDQLSYAIFIFFLILLFDFLPILMFIANLKYVFSSQTPLTPKLREAETPDFDMG